MPLPKELEDAWKRAEETGQPVEAGRSVVCDSCTKDYTDLPDEGGIVFGSSGYGPCCAPRMLADARKFGEMKYVSAQCPAGTSYADFIRTYRQQHSSTTVRIRKR